MDSESAEDCQMKKVKTNSSNDIKDALRKGLLSNPKYIPVWYRYDKQGSILNDRCLNENQWYYFANAEINTIKENLKAITNLIQKPTVLFDMGSGNSVKTKYFIDAILKEQKSLKYYPVDISEEFLLETSENLRKEYGDSISVEPLPGDYTNSIEAMRCLKDPKLIIWLGGPQVEPYERQISLMSLISDAMSDKDILLITLDVTQNKDEIKRAYFDPTGFSSDLYFNAIYRLNREMGANIDTNSFYLQFSYVENHASNCTSYTQVAAKSKYYQRLYIPGLDVTISIEKDEPLNLFEGDSLSCKYTPSQINHLATTSGLRLTKIWMDQERHAALCCMQK